MKITRRAIARMLAAVPVAAAPQASPQASPEDPVQRARDQFEKNTRAMAAVKIPISTEPAFRFKA